MYLCTAVLLYHLFLQLEVEFDMLRHGVMYLSYKVPLDTLVDIVLYPGTVGDTCNSHRKHVVSAMAVSTYYRGIWELTTEALPMLFFLGSVATE